ncbi:MAG: exopolyphosphatase [Pseudomonadota bacterium]
MNKPDENELQKEIIAAVDLGSNSFHLVVAQNIGHEITLIDRLKEKVQLGKGLTIDNYLTQEAIDRGLACLQRFSNKLDSYRVSRIRAVGTNTLRVAKNRIAFLDAALHIFPEPINIIAGREEARLIYNGVRHSGHGHVPSLVIDIGGGSTEIILGVEDTINCLDSLHMGCVVYQSRYFSGTSISQQNFNQAVTAASLELLPIIEQYKQQGWQKVIGTSGTIQSISNIFASQGSFDGFITLSKLYELRDQLVAFADIDYVNIDGICSDRKSILPAGLAILVALFEALDIEKMTVCDAALREGLLYEMIDAENHVAIRESSVERLIRQFHIDIQQAQRVEQTVLHAFDQVRDVWEFDEDAKQLLVYAAKLHETGQLVSVSHIHKHSAYILKNADLPGFNQTQKLLISSLVRGSRRKFPFDLFDKLPSSKREVCMRLCRLLRLAVVIHHARIDGVVNDFSLCAKDNSLSLTLSPKLTASFKLLLPDLMQERKYMESVGFGFSVHVEEKQADFSV